MDVATFVTRFLGPVPVRIRAFDGSVAEPARPTPVSLVLRSRDGLARILTRPGELGLARAYVTGGLDVEGDLRALVDLEIPRIDPWRHLGDLAALVASVGPDVLRPRTPPAIEARPRGRRHARGRDRATVTHHYDVSNEFYALVLGPSMAYSCAVFAEGDDDLTSAQTRKVDLVARKLGLGPEHRLLDIGCGWGTMAIHAARAYGTRVVGITLSEPQAALARERAAAAGVGDLTEFRVADYRDVADGPFDAISSIGMVEHVGRRALPEYVSRVVGLLAPGGRYLNHAIARPSARPLNPTPTRASEVRDTLVDLLGRRASRTHSPFIDRYVFPDGELHEVGSIVTRFQRAGLELAHLESLREHYALTLDAWVANLEAHAAEAESLVGAERLRVWRLYMTASSAAFTRHHLEVHQALFVKPDGGRSGLPRRPAWALAA